MKEAQIHKAVIDHWKAFGKPDTLVATIPNMRAFGQHGLTKGLFDLLVISPSLGTGFIELKPKGGKLSTDQLWFFELCNRAEIPVAVTYGRDEPIRVLENWSVVRRQAA